AESKERFQEALDIILQAWSGETFSYAGKYNRITNATLSPLPYQKPYPPIRIAASSGDSFGRIGRLGYPIFLGLRVMDLVDLETRVVFGSPESVIDRLNQFQEMLGITGITAELNPGGFLPKEAVHRSLRLLTEKVIPAFK